MSLVISAPKGIANELGRLLWQHETGLKNANKLLYPKIYDKALSDPLLKKRSTPLELLKYHDELPLLLLEKVIKCYSNEIAKEENKNSKRRPLLVKAKRDFKNLLESHEKEKESQQKQNISEAQLLAESSIPINLFLRVFEPKAILRDTITISYANMPDTCVRIIEGIPSDIDYASSSTGTYFNIKLQEITNPQQDKFAQLSISALEKSIRPYLSSIADAIEGIYAFLT